MPQNSHVQPWENERTPHRSLAPPGGWRVAVVWDEKAAFGEGMGGGTQSPGDRPTALPSRTV
jgi:hypothetical protein